MSPSLRRRILALALISVGVACITPSIASAQATRTWVSGVGDDANPCSRTAPCKTFAGAISKTAAKGEINTLDPGGFGGVTITKSITIRSKHDAGVLVSGTNAIVVNAAATDRVILAGLDIQGIGTGLAAIRVLSARDVKVFRSSIEGFTRGGVEFVPSNGTASNPARLYVQDTDILNSGPASAGIEPNGILVQPSGTGVARAGVVRTTVSGYHNGIVARGTTRISVQRSSILQNTNAGIFASGASAQIRLGHSEVSDNTFGLSTSSGGSIFSFGNNMIAGNTTDGTPTSTVAPM